MWKEIFRDLSGLRETREGNEFELSGPKYLNPVDWGNENHQRSVAACLVKGVYVLEYERRENTQATKSLAPPWWEFFHFQKVRSLKDNVESIFGAVYEFKTSSSGINHLDVPNYVIAFRGTIWSLDNQDYVLDLKCVIDAVHRNRRFDKAMEEVRNVIKEFGSSNIWIAGHSLGSAMGMLAGKNMARQGIFMKAFLFNQPFISALNPLERIKSKKVKHGIRTVRSFFTAGVTKVMKGSNREAQSYDPFIALSEWVPSLFVHPKDLISSGYIEYFEHRKRMEDMGAGQIERLATQNQVRSLLLNLLLGRESEPLHLLPSARLITNMTAAADFKQAHGIQQWWSQDLYLQTKLYKY